MARYRVETGGAKSATVDHRPLMSDERLCVDIDRARLVEKCDGLRLPPDTKRMASLRTTNRGV